MLWVVLSLFAVYGIVCLAILLLQEKLIFYPGAAPELTPAASGLEFHDRSLVARDGTVIHGWFVPAQGRAVTEPAGVVLMCHGNAGNVESRLVCVKFFARAGFAVLLFDYRGYGRSEGRPSEEGTYLDAEAAHEHLITVEGFAPAQILVLGESLGGAVATELVRRKPVAGLILENTFTSLPDIGAKLYPWFPVRWLARFRFDSAAKIGALERPVLVIHTPDDEVVPFEHGRALFEAAREPKRFLTTDGPHNGGGFLRRKEWRDAVVGFAETALGDVGFAKAAVGE